MPVTNKIYVDIQSLLDIRQSVLAQLMGVEETLTYINTDEYNFRDIDKFPVDMEAYKNLMDNKDGLALRQATITYIEVVLKSKINSLEKIGGFSDDSIQPEIVLNTYPYQLTREAVGLLQNAVFLKLGQNCHVKVVYDAVSVWSPVFIKQNKVSAAFIYDLTSWMNRHGESLSTQGMKECNIYSPAIGKIELTPAEDKQIKKLGFNDIYAYTEYIMSSACRIQFLPIVFYTNIVTATVLLDKHKSVVESLAEVERERTKGLAEDILKTVEENNDDSNESHSVPG